MFSLPAATLQISTPLRVEFLLQSRLCCCEEWKCQKLMLLAVSIDFQCPIFISLSMLLLVMTALLWILNIVPCNPGNCRSATHSIFHFSANMQGTSLQNPMKDCREACKHLSYLPLLEIRSTMALKVCKVQNNYTTASSVLYSWCWLMVPWMR